MDLKAEEGKALGTVVAASDINVRSEAAGWLSRRLAAQDATVATLTAERDEWCRKATEAQHGWRTSVDQVAALQAKVEETKRKAVEGVRRWQGQVDELRAEVERLKAEAKREHDLANERWRQLQAVNPLMRAAVERAEAAESRLAAIRERGARPMLLTFPATHEDVVNYVRWVLDGKES